MWQCAKCQEKNQQNFDTCWNCGTKRDDIGSFRIEDDKPDVLHDSETDPADPGRTPLLKQAYVLTPDDLARYPVWVQCHLVDYDEPWYEETDEATFRPWTGRVPVDPQESTYLIRANLTLANGLKLYGFLTPQSAEGPLDLGTMQPIVFSASGEQLAFWDGAFKRSEEERVAFYAALGLRPNEVFPVCFSCEPDLALGRVAGSIKGLCYLKDFKKDFKEVQFYA